MIFKRYYSVAAWKEIEIIKNNRYNAYWKLENLSSQRIIHGQKTYYCCEFMSLYTFLLPQKIFSLIMQSSTEIFPEVGVPRSCEREERPMAFSITCLYNGKNLCLDSLISQRLYWQYLWHVWDYNSFACVKVYLSTRNCP